MSATISEITKGAHGTAEWHIKNWATDFDVLKDNASCTLEINEGDNDSVSSPIKVRFFLKRYEENFISRGVWFSLNADLISMPRLDFHGQNVVMSIDIAALPSEQKQDIQEISDIRCTFNTTNSQENGTAINLKFIQVKEYRKDAKVNWIDCPQPDEIHVKITATILKINKTSNNDEDDFDGLLPASEASFTRDVKMMYGAEENFSDLRLETKDNMTLSGHRFILAARSPVFRKLIEAEVKKEGFSGVIQVSSVNAKPLIVVLHWMYTGELHGNAANVMEEVVKICAEFEIPDLLKILDKKLITICVPQNMFQLFDVAVQNGMTRAKENIGDFIKENIDKRFT